MVRKKSMTSNSLCNDSELLPVFDGISASETSVVSTESGDSIRPLRRTACSCPNCRDGTNRFVL